MEADVAIDRVRTSQLARLYAQHGPRAGKLAYLLTADPELAQDLAQEAFARLIGRFGSLRSPEAVEAYLRRTVINLARNHWRRAGRERAYVQREGPRMAGRTANPPDVAASDAVWQALNRLPYRHRAALILRFYEDLSERQTAEALGCPIGTVKSLVSRGLRTLRVELGGEFE